MESVRNILTPKGTRSLFTLFVMATIVPLVVLVALPLKLATSALDEQEIARVADSSSSAGDAIVMQLDAIKALTSAYSMRAEVIAAAPKTSLSASDPLHSTLREYVRSNPYINSAVLLNVDGRIVTSEPIADGAIDRDFSGRDYFVGARNRDDAYVSEIFESQLGNRTEYVAVSKRVLSPQGKALGVIVALVDSKAVFQTYVETFSQERNIDLTIYDQNSKVIASRDHARELTRETQTHVSDALKGSVWSGTTNNDTVSAFTPIPEIGWVVEAKVERDAAFANKSDLIARVVIIALIAGAVVLTAIALLARNIREREGAERRLRSSESRTRTIINTAHQMFCEVDETCRITDWNAQAEKLLGWSRAEAIGQDAVMLLIPEGKRDHMRKRFTKSLLTADPQPHDEIVKLQRKNTESCVAAEVSYWVTDLDGRRSLNLFVRDVTERLRLQREQEIVLKRQRALVDELRAADKTKSDFISTVSHELRTPLTSITGYLEMLKDGLGGPLNQNQQMMVDVVERNAYRLLDLIEDILTLSRIESGSFEVKSGETDIRSIVNRAVETLLPQIHTNGLVLEVDVASDVGTIMGDPDQLERAVLNVLSNAVKFTPEGGRLSLTAYRRESSVCITVSDSGVGIPVEEQARLFSRFFRASTAQSQAVQGTGLGLTIVKSIVESHGGTISLQSAPGVGTTVYVELPTSADIAENQFQ